MTPPSENILTLGFSPCPNDTYIFNGMVHGPVRVPGYRLDVALHDVETLNRMAADGVLDVTKLSFYAWLTVRSQYRLLASGGALGYGCGPVVIAPQPLTRADMARCRIVLPGEGTTAHLLFRLWAPDARRRLFTTYDRIFDTLRSGEADCGVIIHESRFTFQDAGFHRVADLGAWWEEQSGLPIPLGCIAMHRRHPQDLARQVEGAIRRSILEAQRDPDSALPYIRQYAQEMTPKVLEAHIRTFVNDFSLDLGEAGRSAVTVLESKAKEAGLIP